MKFLIKTAVIILTIALAFTLSGCGMNNNGTNSLGGGQGTQTASDIYKKVLSKNRNIKTGDMDVDLKINTDNTTNGEEITVNSNIKIDATDRLNRKIAMSGKTTTPTSGNVEFKQIYVDNVIYIESNGMKYKSAVNKDTAEDIVGDEDIYDIFNFDRFTELNVTSDGSDKVLNFKCNEEGMADFIDDFIEDYANINDIDFNNISGTFIIDKNYKVKSLEMLISAVTDNENMRSIMNMQFNIKVNSLGEAVQITAPTDANSYVEIDPNILAQTTAA